MAKRITGFIAAIFLSIPLYSQVTVPNGGFEEPDNSSLTKTAGWIMEGDNFQCATDSISPFKGIYSLRISSKTEGNHFFKEDFPFSTTTLKKYKIKCAFKTNNMQGAVKLGVRVLDENGISIFFTHFALPENRTGEWQTGEGEFITDNSAASLRVFGNLAGTGEAWFDELTLEEIPLAQNGPSKKVMNYIDEFFDIVYKHSIIRDKIYIDELKRNTIQLCGDNLTMDHCHKILKEYTIRSLRDRHSFFTTPREWKAMTEEGIHPVNGQNLRNFPVGKMLENNIAYISLPTFVSNEKEVMSIYADSIQNMIANFDNQNPKGYIIDLSKNGGGNCFPMVAGVGPLIGNGVCGISFSGNGKVSEIIYDKGWTGRDAYLVFKKSNPYSLKNEGKPIAVIYGNGTASSGEVTAIAFIGLPNTKSFGQATAGATTRIDNFKMSDGSYLNLAAGVNADRNKNKFGSSIIPEVETKDTGTAIAEAVKWILGE